MTISVQSVSLLSFTLAGSINLFMLLRYSMPCEQNFSKFNEHIIRAYLDGCTFFERYTLIDCNKGLLTADYKPLMKLTSNTEEQCQRADFYTFTMMRIFPITLKRNTIVCFAGKNTLRSVIQCSLCRMRTLMIY